MFKKSVLQPKKNNSSFTRSGMLQHSDFFQFLQVNLEKPSSPHSIHNNLRERIEDLGCTTELDEGPVKKDHWTMTVGNYENLNIEADYITFEGRIVGSIIKLRDWPWWCGVVNFIGWLTLIIVVGALILWGLARWKQKNPRDERGDLYILYNGTYQRPEKLDNQIKDWVISLDVMMSYTAASSGEQLIKPIFNNLKGEADSIGSKSPQNLNKQSDPEIE